jgi:hypothetical protein
VKDCGDKCKREEHLLQNLKEGDFARVTPTGAYMMGPWRGKYKGHQIDLVCEPWEYCSGGCASDDKTPAWVSESWGGEGGHAKKCGGRNNDDNDNPDSSENNDSPNSSDDNDDNDDNDNPDSSEKTCKECKEKCENNGGSRCGKTDCKKLCRPDDNDNDNDDNDNDDNDNPDSSEERQDCNACKKECKKNGGSRCGKTDCKNVCRPDDDDKSKSKSKEDDSDDDKSKSKSKGKSNSNSKSKDKSKDKSKSKSKDKSKSKSKDDDKSKSKSKSNSKDDDSDDDKSKSKSSLVEVIQDKDSSDGTGKSKGLMRRSGRKKGKIATAIESEGEVGSSQS